MKLEDISFDENDQNLFQVDDARLRADALKHSIVPRLHILMNECISQVRYAYDIEALEDSIVSYYPNFRTKREKELNFLYEAAYVGLGGKREKDKWQGVERKDKKVVQILPFRFGIQIDEDGLRILMENYWLKGLTDASYKKYLDFHLEFEGLTHRLCYLCEMSPVLYSGKGLDVISTFKEHYDYMVKKRLFDNAFFSQHSETFPISPDSLRELIYRYVLFFPIYDSYIQISKGEPVRFLQLISKANRWIKEIEEGKGQIDEPNIKSSEHSMLNLKEIAEKRLKVMPSIRWQVFQRDNWRCVACGRTSQDDVILHVDHIIPRSKGGRDTLENYQTLCNICNLGKSNKNDTNLRSKV